MSQVFTETDRERLKALVPDMNYYIENKLNFALRTVIPGADKETFVITTSAHSEDVLIYETPITSNEPLNFDIKDGGFF